MAYAVKNELGIHFLAYIKNIGKGGKYESCYKNFVNKIFQYYDNYLIKAQN